MRPRWGSCAARFGTAAMLAGAVSTALPQTQAAGNPLNQLPLPAPFPEARKTAPRVELQAPAGAEAAADERRITARRFDIEGVGAVPFADIARLFTPLVGEAITVGQLVAAAREATALYKTRGHPLSFVFIPAQDFEGGAVRVVAVEGYIASVRIEGDAGPAEPKLREIAERLQTERPLQLATFERVSQLLARMPGLTVTAEASLPSTTDGATALVLKVRRQPYNVSVGADVRQPTSRAVLSGVVNDPVAPGGQLIVSTLLGKFSKERLLSAGYSQLIGADGLTVKTNLSDYRGYPDEALGRGAPIERYNTNRRAELSASYPLLLDARSSITLNGGTYAVNNVDEYRAPATGAMLAEETRVRALFAQFVYAANTDTRSRTAGLLVARGLNVAGAEATQRSNVPGVAGTNAASLDFTRVTFDAAQRDRFANGWGTGVSFGAQYSGQTLASSERVSFGGVRFGRGYAAGDAAGDSGWGIGLELNRLFRLEGDTWLRQIEPYVLFEAAQVSTQLGRPSPRRLRSVALGLRVSDSKHYSVDVALAKPTGDASPNNPSKRPRVSLMLTYQLDAQ